MSKTYPNFYETVKEANMRLRGTIVLYDKEPYYVLGVADHKGDGIFRIYLDPLSKLISMQNNPPPFLNGSEYNSFGVSMDAWLEANKDRGILRKHMTSTLFNKYRPFPLGMANYQGDAIFIERHPTRKTEQGLTESMLIQNLASLTSGSRSGHYISFLSSQMADCIKGVFPSYEETISNLKDPDVVNRSVAFSRHFAVIRGPVETLFLLYKNDVIGIIDYNNPQSLKIAQKFLYTKESVESLNIFTNIN
jgi:hypothetical protein